MSVEERIDALIEAGWSMLDSDFDPFAFRRWRLTALDCLSDLLRPNHTYTLYFRTLIEQNEKLNCLAGGGILTAARYAMAGTCAEQAENGNEPYPVRAFTGGRLHTAWSVPSVGGAREHPLRHAKGAATLTRNM